MRPSVSQTKAQLKNITSRILSSETSFIELKDTLDEFKRFLTQVTELNLEASVFSENVHLKEGKAIATKWAAMCVEDLIRTQRFISAVKKAIEDALRENPEKPVNLLYAGTGPFATLVLPLTTVFSASELQLHLIEVNELSIRNARELFRKLELNDYVKEWHHADASTIELPETNVDIVLVECLQHALLREPQVAITLNLVNQLPTEVILIPKQIRLHLAVVNSKLQYEFHTSLEPSSHEFYTIAGEVFSIEKSNARNPEELLQSRKLQLDEDTLNFGDHLSVFTEMKLYDDVFLNFNESGLTLPLTIGQVPGNVKQLEVSAKYLMGEDPRLDFTL